MSTKSSFILQTLKVGKSYETAHGPLSVLKDVEMEVEAGETLAIVGPSGSGKTTFLGLLAGLDVPSSGSVVLDGVALETLNEDERAQVRNEKVGFVFQNYQLLPTLTALENVMVPLELRGDFEAEKKASDLLERVGLAERKEHYPVQLSGGEQQRVALARAFINQPKILFADEPTGNLDGSTSERIVDLLFELNREWGTTLVLVTHDREMASQLQRTVRIRDGVLGEV